MREILFRGKRTDTGEWVYGFYRKYTHFNRLSGDELYTKHFIGVLSNKVLFDEIFEQIEVTPESVGQYTCLADKEGNKIFEGDIVKFQKETHLIKYFDNWGMFGLMGKSIYRDNENNPLGSSGSSTT